jgi:hypothetical protein
MYALHVVVEPSFLSLYSLLFFLRYFCRYLIGGIEKARRTAAFLSWYSQTSLPEVRFALTLHAWTRYFSFTM